MQTPDSYKFLEKTATDLGAADAKVISADRVVVEDRARLKCRVGCPAYGTNLKCPPYAPTPDEFRKILKEYGFAMVVKLKPVDLPRDLIGPGDAGLDTMKERLAGLRPLFVEYYRNKLAIVLELEKAAFARGYTFATAFFGGPCPMCENCNVEKGVCLNPSIARIAAVPAGINWVKTAENAGFAIKFSLTVQPAAGEMMLLLID